MNATISSRDVRAGDVTFRLNESGEPGSPPVVWLHGSGPGVTAMTNWERQLADLAGDFHNLAPDVVGFGDSTHPDPPPVGLKAFTELRVRTLLALLDELGLERVSLVGNSMGGIISLALVIEAPERVDRIVLMGSGGAPMRPTPELIRLIMFYDDDPSAESMAELMSCFVHDPASFGDDLQAIAAARMPRAMRPEVERSHRATFAPGEPLAFAPEALASVAQPVLLLHGASDRVIPMEASEWLAQHLPNARLEVVPEAGHWLQIERPQRFAQLVRAFLGAAAGSQAP